jgi:hypothetical protein
MSKAELYEKRPKYEYKNKIKSQKNRIQLHAEIAIPPAVPQ